MPKVHWVQKDGERISEDLSEGAMLMDAAQFAGVKGIEGMCGGCLSCATCHVVVDEAWASKCPPMDASEDAMLEATSTPREPNSRLSCQLYASADLDGLVLYVRD